MAQFVTISDFRQYATNPIPLGAEIDALIQVVLDRSEALVMRYLTGVIIDPPAPEDLKQVILEVAWSMYITRGMASRLETVGASGQGSFQYVGYLTNGQMAALRQIRIELDGVAF